MPWLPVVGYEGFYEVSDMGEVRRAGSGRSLRQAWKGKYLGVSLSRGGRVKQKFVHRLVVEAFIGPRPSKAHQCNHLNGNRRDNRAANLEWTTRSGNVAHAWDTGLRKADPEGHGSAKLTWDQVRKIRAQAGEKSHRQLAAEFGVHHVTIGLILRGVTWREDDDVEG